MELFAIIRFFSYCALSQETHRLIELSTNLSVFEHPNFQSAIYSIVGRTLDLENPQLVFDLDGVFNDMRPTQLARLALNPSRLKFLENLATAPSNSINIITTRPSEIRTFTDWLALLSNTISQDGATAQIVGMHHKGDIDEYTSGEPKSRVIFTGAGKKPYEMVAMKAISPILRRIGGKEIDIQFDGLQRVLSHIFATEQPVLILDERHDMLPTVQVVASDYPSTKIEYHNINLKNGHRLALESALIAAGSIAILYGISRFSRQKGE